MPEKRDSFYKDMDAFDVVRSLGTEVSTQIILGYAGLEEPDDILKTCSKELAKVYGWPQQPIDPFSLLTGAVWHDAVLKMYNEAQSLTEED